MSSSNYTPHAGDLCVTLWPFRAGYITLDPIPISCARTLHPGDVFNIISAQFISDVTCWDIMIMFDGRTYFVNIPTTPCSMTGDVSGDHPYALLQEAAAQRR